MYLKTITLLMAGAMGAGAVASADPPHKHRHDLPPGLAKQGKIPPGHAKKMWRKGEYLPVHYRDVRVREYRHYDLREPPRGYRWVHVDEDAYLVEIASGLIAEVLVNALTR